MGFIQKLHQCIELTLLASAIQSYINNYVLPFYLFHATNNFHKTESEQA